MSFLTGLAASVLEWFLSKFLSFVGEEITLAKEDQAIATQAKTDEQTAVAATTPDQISAAAAGLASDTFKQ